MDGILAQYTSNERGYLDYINVIQGGAVRLDLDNIPPGIKGVCVDGIQTCKVVVMQNGNHLSVVHQDSQTNTDTEVKHIHAIDYNATMSIKFYYGPKFSDDEKEEDTSDEIMIATCRTLKYNTLYLTINNGEIKATQNKLTKVGMLPSDAVTRAYDHMLSTFTSSCEVKVHYDNGQWQNVDMSKPGVVYPLCEKLVNIDQANLDQQIRALMAEGSADLNFLEGRVDMFKDVGIIYKIVQEYKNLGVY